MPARSLRRWIAVVAAVGVLAAGCTTSRKTNTSTGGTGTTGGGTTTASARGVTANTIKIGFSYIDLEALAKSGIIKIDHGPYAKVIKVLVDDVNARGGINGRKLQLSIAKYSPIGNDEQLAACTKLTEDDQVFAVLDGFLTNNNLCVVQQHSTALVGGNLNGPLLAKARAPWATWAPSDERSITALVKAMDQNGYLKGHTIAVYSSDASTKPLVDAGVKALDDAGYKAADTALLDAPATDVQAATAQDKVIAERFKNKGVDTVILVGQFTPGADFDAVGFHPGLFSISSGNIAAAAFTNPLEKFPIVAGLGGTSDPNAGYNTAEMRRCREVYKKATGIEIKTEQEELAAKKSTGGGAMSEACTAMQIFVAAAKAAGKNLNNETFAKGVASIGKISLPSAPVGVVRAKQA